MGFNRGSEGSEKRVQALWLSSADAVQQPANMKRVDSFEKLICWQRANEVTLGVYVLIRSDAVPRPRKRSPAAPEPPEPLEPPEPRGA